ncbi:hypothetical protein BHE74_00003736 [Ensete ventricosum]|nr:hypothetical protein BHE74_00003736 [Ensete ventricosum]RZR97651.1 hypothetical protein BHM03_00026880 [Ensete ventricosum]
MNCRACMQISERFTSNLRAIFEEFLSKWKYVDGGIYVLTVEEMESSSDKVGIKQSVMEAKDYLEVAEVYTITILGMVLCSPDLAISWTEKAELPEESRQVKLSFPIHCHLLYYAFNRLLLTPASFFLHYRSVATQAAAVKRALVDAWQLAFSVQVNPLAAIQQLPSAPHGSML